MLMLFESSISGSITKELVLLFLQFHVLGNSCFIGQVRKITFIGSTNVGKLLMTGAGKTEKCRLLIQMFCAFVFPYLVNPIVEI